MKIYNTLSKIKEEFVPIDSPKVKMFVCGPTVYDYIHIGNARTFVFFDVVAKYLKYKGYDVTYIQNITDIDNKIIERAQKEGTNPLEYAKKYADIFKKDMKALGITSPEYKNATDHIPEVIKQVQALLDKGNAYVIENDGIYFDLATFPDYGKLSGRTANMAEDAVSRIDDSDKKRNRGDFALWKFAQPDDPSWPAPFGEGRPGWHIEDTAITEKYFGPQYDIHGGGQDLMFPHHEAEIAQQESASGLKPFVKYWMHAGFLINKDEKMSKSAGNFSTLREALKKYSPDITEAAAIIRFYFLSAHYRSPLDYNEELIRLSFAGIKNIREVLENLKKLKNEEILKNKKTAVHLTYIENYSKLIFEAIDNDFNTQEAFGLLSGLVSYIYQNLREIDIESYDKFMEIINFFDKILGNIVIPEVETVKIKGVPVTTSIIAGIAIDDEIRDIMAERELARRNKSWGEADKLRDKLKSMGYDVKDTPYGPTGSASPSSSTSASPSPSPEPESE